MPSISIPAAVAIGGLGAAGSLASGLLSSGAAKSAAKTQAQAAQFADQQQLAMFQQIQANLSPFTQLGTGAASKLASLTGTGPGGNPLIAPLTAPFQPTQAQLAATPGYQFVLNQGLQGVQNSYAAQGLGSSGAALKGAANYAEGLAGTTYQQQFQNYLNQNQQIANLISGQITTGENAAAMTGSLGTQNTLAANNFLTSGAAATAAGTVGATNALTSSLSNLTGTAGNAALLLALNNQGMFGGGGNYGTSGTGGL